MAIAITTALMRAIFPKAPQPIIDAFVASGELHQAGLTDAPARLAYLCANIHAETAGYTIPGLVENINYSAERMAQVWPNRFASAASVRAKYGAAPGWQKAAFDDIYGGRMGNRPGSHDGSTYIGRGGPQITGRDGYAEIGRRIGVDLVGNPSAAASPALQPAIAAAFWAWKGMNRFADAGDFLGCVKAWNGGTNGLAERQAQLRRIGAILAAPPAAAASKPPSAAVVPAGAVVAGSTAAAAAAGTAHGLSWTAIVAAVIGVVAAGVLVWLIWRARRNGGE